MQVRDDVDLWLRRLINDFTPDDLRLEFLRIEPLPGPKPRGNISVTTDGRGTGREV